VAAELLRGIPKMGAHNRKSHGNRGFCMITRRPELSERLRLSQPAFCDIHRIEKQQRHEEAPATCFAQHALG